MTRQTRQGARPSPTTLVPTLALLAALVSALALAPRAEAFVYWGDNYQHAIGRANLDGTQVDEFFISGINDPTSIDIDARHIYWGTSSGLGPGEVFEPPAIARADLDGAQVNETFIAGVSPGDIAVGDDHIYWTDYSEPAIGRANLDGTVVERGFVDPGAEVSGIAVDANHIYWGQLGSQTQTASIGRANLDGTGVERGFVDPGAEVSGIAVDANHIYWGQLGSQTQTASIGRANLDGTAINRAFIPFTDGTAPFEVEVDAAHIYWISPAAQPTFSTETIGRANLDGTGVDHRFIEGVPEMNLEGLAVDAGHIYWDERGCCAMGTGFGSVGRGDIEGGNIDHGFITLGPPSGPTGVAVNFSLGKLKLDKERGTGKLTVEVPAAGDVALARTAKVKGAEVRAEAAGKVRLAIKPRGKAKKKLAQHGKAKVEVEVEVTYTPDGGEPEEQVATLRLKR
jgi:virginiamycin B lyase